MREVTSHDDPGHSSWSGLSPSVRWGPADINYPKRHVDISMGWFATADIAEGEEIYRPHEHQERFEYTLEEILAFPKARRRRFFRLAYQVDEDVYSGYHSDTEITEEEKGDWYCNHSCDPNAWFVGKDHIAARREIKEGEEIMYDYCMSETNAFMFLKCMCGSKLCRGELTGQDYQKPELRKRYGEHFLPYVNRKIARESLQRGGDV